MHRFVEAADLAGGKRGEGGHLICRYILCSVWFEPWGRKSGGRVIFLSELGKVFLLTNVDRVVACLFTNHLACEAKMASRVGAYFAYRVV